MKAYHFRFILLILIVLGSRSSFAVCSQTISPGAAVASVISSAAAGTTICLSSGSYGSLTFDSIVKSSDVTIESASGRTASLDLNINGSNHLKFQNLTILGLQLSGGNTKNITIRTSTLTGQAVLDMRNNSNANILIDGNTFDGISVCGGCYEGRLQIHQPGALGSQPVGVKVTNNHFGGAGESDGIQIGAYGVVVGPGNEFTGIVQSGYSRHVDSIQLYGQSHTTITGNYFHGNDVNIMAPDGGDTEVVTNNIFVGGSYVQSVQFGSHNNNMFSHNTVINVDVQMDAKNGEPASANFLVQNNIMINSSFDTNRSDGSAACTNCTYSFNLFQSSGDARGTNNVIGTPTFVGGATPSTWAGYRLTSSSLGYQSGADGNDRGTNYYGPSTLPTSLAPPTNLRVQ